MFYIEITPVIRGYNIQNLVTSYFSFRFGMNQRYIRILSIIVIIVGGIIGIYSILFGYDSDVLIQWNTASEVETVGFNLYRSDVEEGPFEQINPVLIPASSDPFTGSSYTYKDHDTVAGNTYYYKLEDVDKDGNITAHGPIEVTAEKGSILILVFAGMLVLIGLIGIIASYRKPIRGELN